MPRPLVIDTLVDLSPLAPELGATDDLPAALQDAVLGDFGTDDGQTKLYAVIDAAQVTGLAEMLENQDLPARCLYTGDALEQHSELAPWIVELKPGDKLLRALMTATDNPDTDATWHLWRKQAGILVRSNQSLDTLWKHFRKYTRIREEGGGMFLFRFFEPDFLAPLLMQAEPGELSAFFAPLTRVIAVEQRRPDVYAASVLSVDPGLDAAPAPMVLTRRKYRALKLVEYNRVAQRICREQNYPTDQHRPFIDTAVRLQDSSYPFEGHLIEAFAMLTQLPFERHAEFWKVVATEDFSLAFILRRFEQQYGLRRMAS